jgi:hypothetical protein
MVGKSLALVFLALVACAAGISFHLPVATRKCLQEDVHKDVLVVGNYEIEASDLTLITLDVSFFFGLFWMCIFLFVLPRALHPAHLDVMFPHAWLYVGDGLARASGVPEGGCGQGQVRVHVGRLRCLQHLLWQRRSRGCACGR